VRRKPGGRVLQAVVVCGRVRPGHEDDVELAGLDGRVGEVVGADEASGGGERDEGSLGGCGYVFGRHAL
jgi:hypothetical protein